MAIIKKIENKRRIDYSKWTDKALLDITDVKLNLGGIPFRAVQECQKRKLRNSC